MIGAHIVDRYVQLASPKGRTAHLSFDFALRVANSQGLFSTFIFSKEEKAVLTEFMPEVYRHFF
jgi:hypothetical protein